MDAEPRYWEPWVPEIGQRVRVCLSGECQLKPCPNSYYEQIGQVGHPEYENGLTGTVTHFERPWQNDFLADQGHTIDVEYDVQVRPWIAPGRKARGGTYAPIELEPIQ